MRSSDMLAGLTRAELELLAGAYFEHQDFEVEHPGGAGASGDIELILSKGGARTLVLCKYPGEQAVDLKAVRELRALLSARAAEHGLIINTAPIEPGVLTYARSKNIALVDANSFEALVARTVRLAVTPACPRCGGAMQKRVARKGQHRGRAIWRCAEFPKCLGNSET